MRSYIVKPGDTFGAIAQRAGVSVATLKKLNPQIADIDRIFVGRIIILPDAAGTPAAPLPPPVPPSPSVSPSQLHAIIPTLAMTRAAELCPPLNQAMAEFLIDSPRRVAAFIAQIAHESGGLNAFVENLNYSAEGLMRTWPQRFPSSIANAYARQPERIANRAYASRLGNGDEASGEGWRYRGRGAIQVTGKSNYQACGAALHLDLIHSPELLEIPLNAFRSAGWFWNSKNLNRLADAGDFQGITKGINGGLNGFQDRVAYWTRAKRILGT